MEKGSEIYALLNGEGEFRFASEYSFYQPVNYPRWQPFYFKHFLHAEEEKKTLPLKLKIERNNHTEEINIIKFISAQDFPSEFFVHHDHYVMIALVELANEEKVIIPCF
jgi:hypothetical protein